MLIHALTEYADTYLADLLGDKAFENKPVPVALYISKEGKYVAVRELTTEASHKGKTKLRPKCLALPKSPVSRVAGVHPLLACDALSYVLGPKVGVWTKETEQKKHQAHFEGFVKLINKVSQELSDSSLYACSTFYANDQEVEKAREALAVLSITPGSNIAIGVVDKGTTESGVPKLLIELPEIKKWWRLHYAAKFQERIGKGGAGICLVDGENGPIVPTNDKIKGASSLGGQAAGVSLMSFDKGAFCSYGWKQNANSPMCPEHAAAYVLALNDLMLTGNHRRGASSEKVVCTRFDAGGTAFLFWTRNPSDDDIASLFQEAQPEEVHRLLTAPFSGQQYEVDDNEFYLLVVSGNGGRLLVRYWFHDKLAQVKKNMRNWFQDLAMVSVFDKSQTAPPRLWQLLHTMATPAMKSDSPLHAERTLFMVRRALHGVPMPRTILNAALNRLRVASGTARFNTMRLGLIRMCVNDIETVERKGVPFMPEQLDESIQHPAYVCGRLLAAYEYLQFKAQGKVNVTVTDRYFGMASTKPQIAFPKLETLSKAHLKKLRRDNPGAGYFVEKQIRDLVCLIESVFPAALDLEDQGRFAIGYHHQKAENTAHGGAKKENAPEGGNEEKLTATNA